MGKSPFDHSITSSKALIEESVKLLARTRAGSDRHWPLMAKKKPPVDETPKRNEANPES